MGNNEVLHLTINRKQFLEIAYGFRTTEFRFTKPYWTSRLINQDFYEVHFRNGFRSSDYPFMRVVFLDVTTVHLKDGLFYAIELGDVLEVKNINLNAYPDPWLTELSIGRMKTGFVSEFIAPNQNRRFLWQ